MADGLGLDFLQLQQMTRNVYKCTITLKTKWSLKTGGLLRQVVCEERWSHKTGGFLRQLVL